MKNEKKKNDCKLFHTFLQVKWLTAHALCHHLQILGVWGVQKSASWTLNPEALALGDTPNPYVWDYTLLDDQYQYQKKKKKERRVGKINRGNPARHVSYFV